MILEVYKMRDVGLVGVAPDKTIFFEGDKDDIGTTWEKAEFGMSVDLGSPVNRIQVKKHPTKECLVHVE